MVSFVKDEVVRLWDEAKNPIILIDACAIRYGVCHLVQDLVNATGAKYFSTPPNHLLSHKTPAPQ